jgi:GH24 family phage-related lysozyme (muramidase)
MSLIIVGWRGLVGKAMAAVVAAGLLAGLAAGEAAHAGVSAAGELRSSYSMTFDNTTFGITATGSLTGITENSAGKISGYMMVNSPLGGSGSFTGTVSGTTVTFDPPGAEYTGTLSANGAAITGGTYSYPSIAQQGTWTADAVKHCACKGITAAEENVIAREEAPGGKPVLRPYNDTQGYCTIGIGHLISKKKCTSADFAKWKGVTASELINLFHQDLAGRERQLNKILITKLRLKLSPCQYNALFDLYYNGGPSWFGPKTRLYKALRAGHLSAVPAILASDVPAKASAKTKKGIKARRERDARQFATRDCPCTSSAPL